uniref:Putative secreted protein n=1 Tax=Anopheles darlingi TaxID=43151 RepID=A0A2M4DJ65_ANODA
MSEAEGSWWQRVRVLFAVKLWLLAGLVEGEGRDVVFCLSTRPSSSTGARPYDPRSPRSRARAQKAVKVMTYLLGPAVLLGGQEGRRRRKVRTHNTPSALRAVL